MTQVMLISAEPLPDRGYQIKNSWLTVCHKDLFRNLEAIKADCDRCKRRFPVNYEYQTAKATPPGME